jgi:putative addiction module component (TIGR02574 family)
MSPSSLSQLLKLPAEERAELAMALWESLSDSEREAELALTPEQETELDRRWAEHLANPETAIPWEQVRRKLERGE